MIELSDYILDEGFEYEVIIELHRRFQKRAVAVHYGRNRNVFEMQNNYVVKIPRNPDGCVDNDWEGSVSNSPETFNDMNEIQYPRTRIVDFEGFPVLFMEKVEYLTHDEICHLLGKEPWWVGCIDCGQVGVTKCNRLVAFDYGLR